MRCIICVSRLVGVLALEGERVQITQQSSYALRCNFIELGLAPTPEHDACRQLAPMRTKPDDELLAFPTRVHHPMPVVFNKSAYDAILGPDKRSATQSWPSRLTCCRCQGWTLSHQTNASTLLSCTYNTGKMQLRTHRTRSSSSSITGRPRHPRCLRPAVQRAPRRALHCHASSIPPLPTPPNSSSLNKGFSLLEWTNAVLPQGKLVAGVKEGWRLAWQTMVRELAPQSKDGAYTRPSYAFGGKLDTPQFPVSTCTNLRVRGRVNIACMRCTTVDTATWDSSDQRRPRRVGDGPPGYPAGQYNILCTAGSCALPALPSLPPRLTRFPRVLRVSLPPPKAASGRYHVYLGNACPWCHRVAIALVLRGLALPPPTHTATPQASSASSSAAAPGRVVPQQQQQHVTVTRLLDDPTRARRGGWVFGAADPDPLFGAADLWWVNGANGQ